MKSMEQEEGIKQQIQEVSPSVTLPVLPRLDRLDRLLELLEEKHSTSRRRLSDHVAISSKGEDEKDEELEEQCKTLSSALDEVHHKGTLMERLATLERRILQLGLEMEEENTSSSSTVQVSKIASHDHDHDSSISTVSRQDEIVTQHVKKEDPLLIQEEAVVKEECTAQSSGDDSGRREKRKCYTKWTRWLIRCGQERHWNDDFGSNATEMRSK